MIGWNDTASWSVVVTGGSSGLGRAVAQALARQGSSVVSLDRREPETTEGFDAGRGPGSIRSIKTDLRDPKQAAAATSEAIAGLGRLDALVCCAGMDIPGGILDVSVDEWWSVVEVNLRGTVSVIRAALPSLLEREGRVVTVASTLGHRPVSDATAYCASKFGVVGFTRALTAEFRGRLGVTLLTPGGMSTSFFDDREEQYRPPVGAPLADPVDVAESVLWLLGRPPGIEIRELAIMAPNEPSWP